MSFLRSGVVVLNTYACLSPFSFCLLVFSFLVCSGLMTRVSFQHWHSKLRKCLSFISNPWPATGLLSALKRSVMSFCRDLKHSSILPKSDYSYIFKFEGSFFECQRFEHVLHCISESWNPPHAQMLVWILIIQTKQDPWLRSLKEPQWFIACRSNTLILNIQCHE